MIKKIYAKGRRLKREDIIQPQPEKKVISDAVREIIENVRRHGDEALTDYTKKFDGADVCGSLIIDREEIEKGAQNADKRLTEALERAAANIKEFHEKQVQTGYMISSDGIVTGQRVIPLETVGIYVPGGTARYPSTVLMNCIPAKIAGVKNIMITTPPDRDGNIPCEILAAAKTAGADHIVKAGGAQAIAALAYGTETIPRAHKITGPGNAYVAEAKNQVRGIVDIDMTAGPSEVVIIACGKNSPTHIALDMLAQAEHDRMASSILITDSESFADAVQNETDRLLSSIPRAEIAGASLEENGIMIITENICEAIDLSNEIAPEHLELCADMPDHNPFDYLPLIKNAGSVFLGRNTPTAVGDYYAGPNHTLPTSGTARFSSPLSVEDFVKKSAYTYYTEDALIKASGDIETIARAEGLDAHALSVTKRRADLLKKRGAQ